ncbi:hypothetical protein [Microbulbifer magnicolonia]|uniref:hypothetical protein n=1 Tax=Microbulbifer magnicolonia TaxID=3109744 RepID=UPI002B408498|nr:hypothetical protein [Microbulbifer sp. GG15]
MSKYEILNTILSGLAILASVVSLSRSKKTSEKLIELENIHAELSQTQLAKIAEDKANSKKADLRISLQKHDGSYKFYIENLGPAKAENIYFNLRQGDFSNPIIGSEYSEKIPYEILNPGDYFTMHAVIALGGGYPSFPITLRWDNEDQSRSTKDFQVSL